MTIQDGDGSSTEIVIPIGTEVFNESLVSIASFITC